MGFLRIIFILLLPLQANALIPDNFFQDDWSFLEKMVARYKYKNEVNTIGELNKRFLKIASDPDNRIDPSFKIPPFLIESVHFWFNVYTSYSSKVVVVHDKRDLSLVYDILDYSKLLQPGINQFTLASLQLDFTTKYLVQLKKRLVALADNEIVDKDLIQKIERSGRHLPVEKKERTAFLKDLAGHIRIQTGLRDSVLQGVKNFKMFKSHLLNYAYKLNLPKELLALSFLESSFNPYAVSKVGATGVWQFMEGIGKHFMKINPSIDHRYNILLSSLSALHLLKDNKKILKNWDFSIVAYNSGMKHILKYRRKAKKNFSFQGYLQNYEHTEIGFPSKNFYAEFLALVYTLKYADEVLGVKQNLFVYNQKKKDIGFYINKCPLKPTWLFKKLNSSNFDLSLINLHILDPTKIYPAGTIFASDIKLSRKKYVRVPGNVRINYFPNSWDKRYRPYKCSKRKVSSEQ